MELHNLGLVIEAVSVTASFRIPEYHNYHKSLPLPPVTTIVGLTGAALGLSYFNAQQYFSNRSIKIGIQGVSEGHYQDLWKALSSKPNNRDTIIQKEYHYLNRYLFVFISDTDTIQQLNTAFQNPYYPTVIGSSDSLLKIKKTVLIENPVITTSDRFENCLLVGNYIDKIKIDLDNLVIGKEYRYTPLSAPQVYNLPYSFVFTDDGVRKIKARKEITFIGMKVKSESLIPVMKYKDISIPIFDHCP
ncbi:MAG TPA: CRISPR-associated protein Cas5 [Bacilli bacterium]|jgi:CRISPR-associated protein Cas5t|nr:CRISPR-associated protein Cas5 [Bacilli bacterium]